MDQVRVWFFCSSPDNLVKKNLFVLFVKCLITKARRRTPFLMSGSCSPAPDSPTTDELAKLLCTQSLNGAPVQFSLGNRAANASSGALAAYVASQTHLLKPTTENPLPTAVPPPISAVAGLLGVRHVLVLIGLPERGKPFIAERLANYLSFFHGAEARAA